MIRHLFTLALLGLIVLCQINPSTAIRLQSNKTSSGSSRKSAADTAEQFNIGLIAPHTNFGKREYLRAINSAIANLQKLKSTKLKFLDKIAFSATNVHFDMMSLTPSPTSRLTNHTPM